jgi:hypothetical protein
MPSSNGTRPKGEYSNLVLFAIRDQRSEDESASDEYGRFIVTPAT